MNAFVSRSKTEYIHLLISVCFWNKSDRFRVIFSVVISIFHLLGDKLVLISEEEKSSALIFSLCQMKLDLLLL